MRRLVLASSSDAALAASAWLRALALEEKLSHEAEFRLDLCLTELVSNAVTHGYADRTGERLLIECMVDPAWVTLRLTDDGIPFDQTAPLPVPHPLNLAEAVPGGAGLPLVREFSDRAVYRREGNSNVTEISVARERPTTAEPREIHSTAPTLSDEIACCALFAGLDAEQLRTVAAHSEVRHWSDGEVILRPGEINRHVAVVLAGRLSIHLDTAGADDALIIGVGECVGEMSVVDSRPVSALVAAQGPCRVLLIEAGAFLAHVLPLPSVARSLLATLASRMRHSNQRIVARIRETAELERVRRELALASQLQAAMLPHRSPLFPGHPRIDCAGRLRSAREVGGDLFDAFFVDPDHLFFVIGDVCDKGIPAALYMVRTLTLLRTDVQAIASASPASVFGCLAPLVASVNRTLFEGHRGELFVSLWCGVLELSSGRLACLNAGHLPPLLLRADEPPRLLESRRNPIVGVVDHHDFEGFETQLAPGDALLLYTDGITEAASHAGELFGDERLTALAANCRTASSERVLDAVFDEVGRFTGDQPQSDDITVLCLRLMAQR